MTSSSPSSPASPSSPERPHRPSLTRSPETDLDTPLLEVCDLSVSLSVSAEIRPHPPWNLACFIRRSASRNSQRDTLSSTTTAQDLSHIISKVSLSLYAGEVMMLTGVSGSGKSTILRAVAGLIPISSGEVKIEGVTTHHACLDRTSTLMMSRIGIMSQSASLFPHLTVAENIEFGLTTAYTTFKVRDHAGLDPVKARVDELLTLFELTEFTDRLPSTLSGGQQRRVALAQTLAPPRDLYLLDEPLSHLEPTLRERLALRMITDVKSRGSALLWASHELELSFNYADRLAVLSAGSLIALDSPHTLFQRPPRPEVAMLFDTLSWCDLSACAQWRQPDWITSRIGLHKSAWSLINDLASGVNESLHDDATMFGDLSSSIGRDIGQVYCIHTPHTPLIVEAKIIKICPQGGRLRVVIQIRGGALNGLLFDIYLNIYNNLSVQGEVTLMYHGAVFWSG